MARVSARVRKVNTCGASPPGIGGTTGVDPVANTSASQPSVRAEVCTSRALTSTASAFSPRSTVTPRAVYQSSSCRQMCSACFSPPSTGESWMRLYACSGSSPMTVIAKRPGTRPVSDAISRVAAIPLPIMTSRIVPPHYAAFGCFS